MELTTLIRASLIVTMDSAGRVVRDGEILIEGREVVAIGKSGEVSGKFGAELRIDARGEVVIPGLIDSHRHLYGILTRGMPVKVRPKDFISFLEDFWWPYVENQLTKEHIYAAAKASALEALKTGTTTVVDILEAPYALPGALEVEARALEEVGLRGYLSFEVTERAGEEVRDMGFTENVNMVRRGGDLVRGTLAIHTTFTCSPECIRRAGELGRSLKARIQLHLEEGDYEKMYARVKYRKLPVELYEDLGFLGPNVIAAQCVTTEPKELEILRRYGVNLVHVPMSNCEVGGGFAPIPEAIDTGLNVGLGTDGYVTNMFDVMRFAFLIHKCRLKNPQVMPAREVFRMATSNAGRALNANIGSIMPGYLADIAILRFKPPTPLSEVNVVDMLALFGYLAEVDKVIVNGALVVDGGRSVRVDEEAVREGCVRASEDLWSRAGS